MCTNGNSYNSRIETLDIYKGFLIFLVVWGHFMMPLIDREYQFSYAGVYIPVGLFLLRFVEEKRYSI